jgi:hypothetical protein
MAELKASLFFQNNRTYKVGNIEFDLILGETHNFSNTITSFNIEDGSVVSDHIQNDLENGSLTGLVSNFSINRGELVVNHAQQTFDKLRELWKNKQLVTIATIYRVYEDVAISSITFSRDEDTGEAISAEISFQQLEIVKLQSVTIEANIKLNDMTNDLNRQSSPNVNGGKNTTNTVPSTTSFAAFGT